MSEQYNIDDLLSLMTALRDPEGGCPWDKAQDFASLTAYTIEEAYEVVDAVSSNNLEHLREELGDLLLQVVFYGQLGKEVEAFHFHQIVDELVKKLLRRHPHVFPNGQLGEVASKTKLSQEEALASWNTQKAKEKNRKGTFSKVSAGLPPLVRAAKLQKKAAKLGFDWPNTEGVFAKVKEELDELNEAVEQNSSQAMEEELGDLLFSCVNLARHLQIDPETALTKTSQKFIHRFEQMEKLIGGIDKISECKLNVLETYWQKAKNQALD